MMTFCIDSAWVVSAMVRQTAMVPSCGLTETYCTEDATCNCRSLLMKIMRLFFKLYSPTAESVWKTSLSFSASAKSTLLTSLASTTTTATVGWSETSFSSCRIRVFSAAGIWPSACCVCSCMATSFAVWMGVAPLESAFIRSAFQLMSMRMTTGGMDMYCCMAKCSGVLPRAQGVLTLARACSSMFTSSTLPPASKAWCSGVLKWGPASTQLTSARCPIAS
mmetsp:Transcript_52547/g.152755  ORF Transcript_52547/g.152755 Transcript_52547/m.152755 type:complete len:221 (+) Transcript_52547:862-1524(+)